MSALKKLKKRSLTSEMERNVKQMLKLIEEEGDSFAQKAEMYYQKRPELISLVEEFYRGYKSLAERYDHDLQSCYSDNGSELNSSWPSPSPRKMGRRISSSRAAGFDFFLGSSFGGNVSSNSNGYYEASHKDGDGSSTLTDSDDDESDASSVNSFNSGFFGGSGGGGRDHGPNRRIIELEMELREVKEKLCMYEDDHGGLSNNNGTGIIENGNSNGNGDEDLRAKADAYEQELRNVNEKLRLSQEEITKLKDEIVKYRSLELAGNLHDGVEYLSCDEHNDNESIGEELRITKLKLKSSEMQISSLRFEASKSSETIQQLQDQLNLSMKEIASWKTKFNSLKRPESTKLQEKSWRLRTSLAEKENEIRDLKSALSNAEQSIFFAKAELKSEISRLLEAQTQWEEEIRKVQCEKMEMEEALNASLDAFKSRAKELEEENERQRCEILEGAEEKREAIRQLCFSLEHYRNGYNKLRKAFIGHKRFPVLAA